MSSNTDNLPPYQEKQPFTETTTPSASNNTNRDITSRIVGTVQTCSIMDFQADYLMIVRDSATSYHISLTVDPTPLYYIKLISSSTKISNIQIFSASDSTLPVAAARLLADPKNKKEPIATICTSSPTQFDAVWRPITRINTLFVSEYKSNIPIITIPGRPATPHQFTWSINLSEPFYELRWEGRLPLIPKISYFSEERGIEYIFATVLRKTADGDDNLVKIRRGGGIDFELSVILELFVISHFQKHELI